MFDIFVLTAAIALLIIFCVKYLIGNVVQVPPGPWGLPLLGYYPFLGRKPVATIAALADKYGEIMTVNYFGKYYYYLNSIELVKEVLVKEGNHTTDRPEQFSINSPFGIALTNKSLVTSSGDTWRQMHSFIMSKMTTLGLGKTPVEQKITIACDKLCNYITKTNGKPSDFYEFLANYAFNVVNDIVFSKISDYNDSYYIMLQENVRKFFITIRGIDGNLSGKLFNFFNRYQILHSLRMEMHRFFIPIVARILVQRLSTGREFNDLIDFFCEENLKNTNNFELETIAENCFVLFTAGTEVVSTTLYHAINLMILHPNVQQKVQQEIDTVIGSDRRISYQDRHLLPYTEAVIHEVQRYACVIPFGIVRSNSKPISVTANNVSYVIPEKSSIIPNIWKLHRDAKYFKNPDNFDPKNFLNENGEFVKNEAHIPFSIGKRMCIGYSLATVELFIAFVTLFQKFRWMSPNEEPVERVIIEAQARVLCNYTCCAVQRNVL